MTAAAREQQTVTQSRHDERASLGNGRQHLVAKHRHNVELLSTNAMDEVIRVERFMSEVVKREVSANSVEILNCATGKIS